MRPGMLHNPLPMTGSRTARRGRRSPSVTDEAIDKIQALIISGSWGPGDRLPKEKELAAQLGLSRSSLREAVRALSQLRVLEVRQGDGTYVTSLEPELLLESTSFVSHLLVGESAIELFEVRRLLEGAAAATRNTFLTSLLASLSSRTMRARMWRGREVNNALDVTRDEHRRIYEAIASGDPELARAAAMAHIASGERWLREQAAAAGGDSPAAPAEAGG